MKQFARLSIIAVAIYSSSSYGSIGGKLNEWFGDMNYSNTTRPGVYQGQTARFATLGGFSTRSPVTYPFNFVNVQMPRYSAGCSGIDIYAGGFSAIDADKLVENLRAIGQNAQSLAFMLAIQTVSPMLMSKMEQLQTWANKINEWGMDSCQAATELVGGTMEAFGARESNCTLKRMQANNGESYTDANYACTTGGESNATEGNTASSANEIDFILGNLSWHVLMQDSFFKADTEFAQMIMNITGTIISTKSGDERNTIMISRSISPAVIEGSEKSRFKNIYQALIYGKSMQGSMKIYKCKDDAADPDACLTVSGEPKSVNVTWEGLHNRVKELMTSIIKKSRDDQPLSTQEIGLISSTRIPVYRFLSVSSTYFPNTMDESIITGDYASLIAHDILLRNLSAIIEKVDQQSLGLRNNLAASKKVKEFRRGLDFVLAGLAKKRDKNEFTAEKLLLMQEQIMRYERALLPKLGPQIISSALWGK